WMKRGVDTIVRGGQVVTASDVVETAVAIAGDTIVAIGPEAVLPGADRVIDAHGKYVLPGLIDCHLHVGPEYDDWTTAPRAAARTGLTTLLPFVIYDEGETLPRAFARLREEAEARSVLDFGFHFILNHEPAILDGIPEAVRQGVTSFKLFMTYKKRGKRMVSDEFIAKTMERLAPLARGEGARAEEHLRRRRGEVHSLRRALARDDGAARLQRGRRQAGSADHVDGPRHGGEPGPHLRSLPAQGRDSRRRGRGSDALGPRGRE